MNLSSGNENAASAKVEGMPVWLKILLSIVKKKRKNKKRQDWGGFIEHLRNNPKDPKTAWEEHYGCLPFHYACCCNAPIDVIREMLDIDPEAAAVKDKWGLFPIFYLLNGESPSIDSLKVVIDAHPTVLSNRSTLTDGTTIGLPVHYAFVCDWNTAEIFQLLFNATLEREHAEIVLWACETAKGKHKEKMEAILECVDSNVLGAADDLGCLALHYACDNPNLSDDFVLQLHEKYLDAAHVRDDAGNHPNIHSRIKSKMENLNSRLEAYNQKVEGLTIATVLSDAARNREETHHNATKAALAEEKKRNRQLEQELCQFKKLRRAKN